MARVETYNRLVENLQYEGSLGSASICDTSSVYADKDHLIVHPFGSAIVWSTANDRHELPSATGQVLKGIVLRNDINEYAADGDSRQGYPAGEPFVLLKQGLIYVFMESAYTNGSPVYFRHTVNGAGKDVLGRWRTDADSGNCDLVRSAEVRFEDGIIPPYGEAGTFAPVYFNLPYYSI